MVDAIVSYELLKELTVLYVEDEDMMRESVVMLLKRRFKDVLVACNGAEALDIFKNNKVDVIIDLQMPVMDGMELAKHIREIDNTPIVVVSAFNDESHQVSEANGRLTKPIKKNDLFDIVLECVSK